MNNQKDGWKQANQLGGARNYQGRYNVVYLYVNENGKNEDNQIFQEKFENEGKDKSKVQYLLEGKLTGNH